MTQRPTHLAGRLLVRATSPPWLSAFAALQLLALCVVGARYHAGLGGLTDEAGRVVTGDFPAFYTAGHLVATGRGRALYDLQAQRRTQERLLGRASPLWQPFAYPALYALAMAPLSRLPALLAFRLHGLLMLLSLIAGFWALWPALPRLSRDRRRLWTAGLLLLGFSPVFRSVVGGHNTPLTLALLMAGFGALAAGKPLRAGLWLGLVSYKPQLLPLLLLWLLLSRHLRTLGAAAALCLLHYGLGVLWLGADWPLLLWRMLPRYQALESAANLWGHVSAPAVLRQLFGDSTGWALASALLVALVARLVRSARAAHAAHIPAATHIPPATRIPPATHIPPALGLGLALICGLVASPHLQYYDVALAALPVLIALDTELAWPGAPSRTVRALLAAGFLLYPLHALGPHLSLQPLVLWLLLPLAWLWRIERRIALGDTPAS